MRTDSQMPASSHFGTMASRRRYDSVTCPTNAVATSMDVYTSAAEGAVTAVRLPCQALRYTAQ